VPIVTARVRRQGGSCMMDMTHLNQKHFYPALVDYHIGKWRRRQGKYDKTTLGCLRKAWRKQPSLKYLLGYLAFRRDLGYLPSPPLLHALTEHIHKLPRRYVHQAVNLLCECGMESSIHLFMDPETLLNLAERSPPAADLVRQNGQATVNTIDVLAELQANQDEMRQQFADFLSRNRGSVCIVGNAAGLSGAGMGEKIDAHDIVVRFNHYRSGTSRLEDTGGRIDVWVRAPNLNTADLAEDLAENPTADWIVLSGPDIRYQLANWEPLRQQLEAGRKILTVPLDIWRALVNELQAPPSAGILLLAWVIRLMGNPGGITATGFQSAVNPASVRQAYHQALPHHRPGHRHDWTGERELLNRWQSAGLILLAAR